MMNRKRLLSLLLAVAMVFTLAAPVAAETHDHTSGLVQVDDSRIQEPLSAGQTADLTPAEPEYEEDEILRVSIFLKKKGTLDAGYSPKDLSANSEALAYNQALKREQETMELQISKAIGQELDVVWNLTLATNLISANVEYGQIAAIKALPGVDTVVIENRYTPDVVEKGGNNPNMATSGTQIGSFHAWAAGYTGAGTRVAIIDTGLDVEHEAFHAGAYTHALNVLAEKNGLDAGAYIDGLNLLDTAEINKVLKNLNAYVQEYGYVSADDLFVSDKIPFGYNYVDGNLDLSHYNSEHGSHVAGISAANTYVPNGADYMEALTATGVRGVASDAQLLVMKVFGQQGGAYDSDIMAAIEDAVLLGSDAVNLSLGSSAPGTTLNANTEYQQIMERLENSGVVVAISAGNNSYWAEESYSGLPYADDVSFHTGGSPGTYTNSLCVASANNAGYTIPGYMTVGDYKLEYMETADYGNLRLKSLAGTQQYIYVDAYGTEADFSALGRNLLAGKIVLCNRGGGTSFSQKANAAVAMGAIGVIIVNSEDAYISMDLGSYYYDAPVVSLLQSYGNVFRYYGTAGYKGGVQYYTGTVTVAEGAAVGYYDDPHEMSAFSSWGVPGSLEMKPEITAPGGWIYSVAGEVYNSDYQYIQGHGHYEEMSGTSMAAPQVAGMSAVLIQYIRENDLAAQTGVAVRTLAQSLLMSTAVPMVDMSNMHYEGYYPVIQQGAGMANVGDAIMADSYIIMGADATDSWADGKVKVELGDDPTRKGEYTFSFTIHNLTDIDKTFVLSGDFFTQALTGEQQLLDTWTRPLTPEIVWAVNGQTVENGAAMAGMDFDGNGAVNAADGQALLDYAAGVRMELTNFDKADLNGDGTVGTYDSYLFFVMLEDNGAMVPAGGSATVTATVTLTENDRAILADYPNGAYLQGYVFAESLATDEGVMGTSHSIPVLGFYGNWSDASMFDKGSFMEYYHGAEDRMPYLYYENYQYGNHNGMIYYDAADDTYYWFGGNPAIQDTVYMPERNALNPNSGDYISTMGFALIRNACGAWYFVREVETGGYAAFMEVSDGAVYPAFYVPAYPSGYWENTYYDLDVGFTGEGIADGTKLEIGIIMPPEYYMDENGDVDLDALGKGAEFSMPLTIDTKDPWIMDWTVDEKTKTMTVSAYDNQYVAAVALYNSNGQLLTYVGSNPEAAPGQTLDFQLDISQVGGTDFLLAVYDYAGNVAAYEVHEQIGEMAEWVDSITVTPAEMNLALGRTAQLEVAVLPVNTAYPEVQWSSDDETVAAVDENGLVTAVGEGSAYVYATSTYDNSIWGRCLIQVEDTQGKLNAIIWNSAPDIWYTSFYKSAPSDYTKHSGDLYYHTKDFGQINGACMGPDGTMYVSTIVRTDDPYGYLYTMNPDTFEVEYLNDCFAGVDVFYADMTYAPAMFGRGMILAAYGPYVLLVEPETGECRGYIDEFSSFGMNIVGIATQQSLVGDYIFMDTVLLAFSDGTVIIEQYISDSEDVVPYYLENDGTRYGWYTDVNVGDSWRYNSIHFDGSYLYWAAFDEDYASYGVDLYAIDLENGGTTYHQGHFGSEAARVLGLHEKNNLPTTQPLSANEAAAYQAVLDKGSYAPKALPEVKLGGSEVASGGSGSEAEPMSEIRNEDGTIVVELTAADANGTAVDSTNGLFTVTYDPEEMTLVNVTVNSQYSAWKNLDGTVTIGYVNPEGIPAGEIVATLKFQPNGSDGQITVIHHEVNDRMPGWLETLTIGCDHDSLTHVPMLAPGCETEGHAEHWICQLCGTCFLDADCTQAVAAGDVVLPAADHTWGEWEITEEPTDDNPGKKERRCSVCGQTESETIPATGILYGDVNGDDSINGKDLILLRQYLAGWDVEPVMQNTDCNGDGTINGKDLILLRQHLAGWDVTLGPEPEEEPHSILGTWVYVTREDWEGDDVALVDIHFMKFNADGTGWSWFENWSNYDLLYGRPADGWVDITPPYSDNSFTYTLEGDRLTVTYAPIEDFEIEAETKVYTLAWNEDGSLTIHYPDGDERTYKLLPRDNMSLEELLELFGFDPNAPGQYEGPEVPVEPDWIVGEWTSVTREDYYDEDLGVWCATVTEYNYIFNEDSTGMTGGYEWTNWDYNNGCPGDHWEIAPMGYEWPSFFYTLEGDRLTINIEYYDRTGDEPDVFIVTDEYIVTKNADGSVTLTREDNGYARVYRWVEEGTTLEEKLALFGLDPNVPEN